MAWAWAWFGDEDKKRDSLQILKSSRLMEALGPNPKKQGALWLKASWSCHLTPITAHTPFGRVQCLEEICLSARPRSQMSRLQCGKKTEPNFGREKETLKFRDELGELISLCSCTIWVILLASTWIHMKASFQLVRKRLNSLCSQFIFDHSLPAKMIIDTFEHGNWERSTWKSMHSRFIIYTHVKDAGSLFHMVSERNLHKKWSVKRVLGEAVTSLAAKNVTFSALEVRLALFHHLFVSILGLSASHAWPNPMCSLS